MKRKVYLLLCVLTLCAWPLAVGCAHKTTRVERSERIEESDPQMLSPGRERVE